MLFGREISVKEKENEYGISNFSKALPDAQSDLALEMTKDPYNFDFLTIRADYDEKELNIDYAFSSISFTMNKK